MTPDQGVRYYNALRAIGEKIPLTAVTTPQLDSSDKVQLQLDLPDNPEGKKILDIAALLCAACKVNQICTTLTPEGPNNRGLAPGYLRYTADINMVPPYSPDGRGIIAQYDAGSRRFVANKAMRGQVVRNDPYIGTSLCTSSKPMPR